MLKNLLNGTAVLVLMSQAAIANDIIINGVPHNSGGTVNIPYGHGTVNCCATTGLSTNTLPVISHETLPAITTHAAPTITTHAAPAVTTYAAPAPIITHDAAPIVTHHAAPVVTHHAAPIVTHHATPTVTHHAAPAFTETVINIKPAPVIPAPAPIVVPAPLPPVVAAPVVAAGAGWTSRVYVGARGGFSNIRDTSFRLRDGSVNTDYEETGYNISGVVGWGAKTTNGLGYRLEAEVGYQTADVSSHNFGESNFTSVADGETSTLYGFVNAYVDVPLIQRLNGVVGGGIGIGQVDFDGHSVNVPDGGTFLDDDDTAFGYHLDAGLSYDVTDRLALEALYRYTSFVDVDVEVGVGQSDDIDVDSHNVLVGARYGF